MRRIAASSAVRLAPLLFLLVLAACGGGSGSGGTTVPPMAPSEEPPPPPPPEEEEPAGEFDTDEFRRSEGLDNINAVPAFEAGGTGEGVIVGVIDTGVDTTQPDLDANISPLSTDIVREGATVVDGDTEGGHGTIVSGIIAAERNNIGILGVAFESTVLMVRAEESGSCETEDGCAFTDDAIAAGIRHAVDNGARAVNISLGGESFGLDVESAVREAAAQGVVIVISAGNDGELDPSGFAQIAQDPIAGDNIIIVGATTQDDRIASFSNRAGNLQASFLAAPGEGLNSTVPQEFCDPGPGACIAFGVGGTSFSAPHVSGAVAVLAQLFPGLTGPEIREILFESAKDLGAEGDDAVFGQGLLDLGAAIQPMGPTAVATTADGSASQSMAGTGMATSAAFGDALAGSGLLDGILMTDRFDRTFRVDLTAAVERSEGRFRPASQVERRQKLAAGAVALGETGRLGFSLYAPAEAPLGDALSSYRRARIAPADPVVTLNGRLDARSDFALAHGLSPARLLDGASAAEIPVGALALSDRLDTPFLGGREAGQALRIGRRIGDGVRLDLALLHADDGGDGRRRFDPLGEPSARTSVVAQIGTRLGPLALAGRIGSMIEDGRLLGARSGGALDLGGGARTGFLGLDLSLPLGRGWHLFGRGTVGRTEATGAASGLVGRLGTLESRAFSAGVTGRSLLLGGDRLTLAAAQPLRVSGGALALRVPVDRDIDTRRFTFETRRRALTPSGREIDLELAYGLRLTPALRLDVHLVRQFEPGHVAGAPGQTSFLLRLRGFF